MELVTTSHVLALLAEVTPFSDVTVKGDKIKLYVRTSVIPAIHIVLAGLVKVHPHFEVVFDTKPLKEDKHGFVWFIFTVIEEA
jgi:hypothetical protein